MGYRYSCTFNPYILVSSKTIEFSLEFRILATSSVWNEPAIKVVYWQALKQDILIKLHAMKGVLNYLYCCSIDWLWTVVVLIVSGAGSNFINHVFVKKPQLSGTLEPSSSPQWWTRWMRDHNTLQIHHYEDSFLVIIITKYPIILSFPGCRPRIPRFPWVKGKSSAGHTTAMPQVLQLLFTSVSVKIMKLTPKIFWQCTKNLQRFLANLKPASYCPLL